MFPVFVFFCKKNRLKLLKSRQKWQRNRGFLVSQLSLKVTHKVRNTRFLPLVNSVGVGLCAHRVGCRLHCHAGAGWISSMCNVLLLKRAATSVLGEGNTFPPPPKQRLSRVKVILRNNLTLGFHQLGLANDVSFFFFFSDSFFSQRMKRKNITEGNGRKKAEDNEKNGSEQKNGRKQKAAQYLPKMS